MLLISAKMWQVGKVFKIIKLGIVLAYQCYPQQCPLHGPHAAIVSKSTVSTYHLLCTPQNIHSNANFGELLPVA